MIVNGPSSMDQVALLLESVPFLENFPALTKSTLVLYQEQIKPFEEERKKWKNDFRKYRPSDYKAYTTFLNCIKICKEIKTISKDYKPLTPYNHIPPKSWKNFLPRYRESTGTLEDKEVNWVNENLEHITSSYESKKTYEQNL